MQSDSGHEEPTAGGPGAPTPLSALEVQDSDLAVPELYNANMDNREWLD